MCRIYVKQLSKNNPELTQITKGIAAVIVELKANGHDVAIQLVAIKSTLNPIVILYLRKFFLRGDVVGADLVVSFLTIYLNFIKIHFLMIFTQPLTLPFDRPLEAG